MVKRGLFVGRFQPFHRGHLGAIQDLLDEVDELIIVIGSAQYSHRKDNPFTAGERLTMIRRALEEAEIPASRWWIVPVPDVHIHRVWTAVVAGYVPKFDIVYSNEPLTKRLFLEAGFKVKSFLLQNRENYSATKIRERILNGEKWKTLVPEGVAEVIEEIGGVQRLRDLAKTDKC